MQAWFSGNNDGFLMGARPIPIRLGQAGMKCYRCGFQGNRLMTPAMAALVPGGCVEVPMTDCGVGATTSTQPTGSTPITWGQQPGSQTGLLQQSTSWDGPTDLVVQVLEPTEFRPLPGANVTVNLFDKRTNAVTRNVASGVTDSSGRYRVTLQAPNPNMMYDYEVIVSAGPGQNFPDMKLRGPARTAAAASAGLSATETMDVTAVVCPSGVDSLICDVAQKQVSMGAGVKRASGVWYIPTTAPIDHSRLKAHWDFYSSWWGNSAILPKEWPELVTNFEQMWGVWSQVPWPRAQLKDLFERCMKRLDLYENYDIWTQEFFVNRYSHFWPKTDEELRRIIAYKALTGLPTIYSCMQERIQAKIRSEEKTMKKWQLIGMAAGMLFTGNIIGGVIFNLASQLSQFNNALDFSKFMMGYQEFVEECRTAEAEDFTCMYLAPFVIWAQEVLLMNEFFDQVAAEAGLPGAQPGLTQEQVIEPMVEELKDRGVDVPKAVYTPGGVAPPVDLLPVLGGVGFVGLLALVGSTLIK